MKIKQFFLAVSLFFICLNVAAQSKLPSADDILSKAFTQARTGHKNIIVIFHASWCVWCRKMDSSMNDLTCKALFDDHYITCHLTVQESTGKKDLENPGADILLKKYHGEDAGLPFWLILEPSGKLLADSRLRPEGAGLDTKGVSIGCPATAEEVNYFLKLLKLSSPLKPDELKVMGERFAKNK